MTARPASLESAATLRDFGFLLKEVSRLYSRNFGRHAARLQLSLDQCRVLAHLARNEGVSQARLAELADLDPMTLGRLLARMEAEGLVRRRTDPADRRARRLSLAPAALPLLDRIWTLADQAREEAFAQLTGAEQAQLAALLRRLRVNLEAACAGPAPPGGEASCS